MVYAQVVDPVDEMKILVIEDSERLRRSLGEGLERVGFSVDLAADGDDGLSYALVNDYDAIVLDLMLPGLDGLSLLKKLRSEGRQTHVLILSAKDQTHDRVQGLEMGADDYLVKPFSFDELQARLRALVRRRYGAKSPVIELGSLAIDTSRRRALRDGEVIRLTPSEYGILEYLALKRGQVLSRDQLVDHLYDSRSEVSSNVIDVLICSLRKKIHQPGDLPLIKTRRGYGYVIE